MEIIVSNFMDIIRSYYPFEYGGIIFKKVSAKPESDFHAIIVDVVVCDYEFGFSGFTECCVLHTGYNHSDPGY